jgi:DNA-binding transcriptional regulator YhcF (GntR family)
VAVGRIRVAERERRECGLPVPRPARELAELLGINANTVLRALRRLRDEGLLEFRRGRGIQVAAMPERGDLVEQVRALVVAAERAGVTRTELIKLIEGA